MKKAILILEQQSWPGGAQRVLQVVLSSLRNDFEPVVAFPDDGSFPAALRGQGITTRTFPLGSYRPGRKSFKEMFSFICRSLVCTVKIAALIQEKQIAVVYINGPRCLPAGAFAAWLTGRPSLFHLHLILTRKSEIFLVTRIARHVTKILACSQAAADSLLNADRRLASKTRVLYNPVPEQFAASRARPPIRPGTGKPQVTLGMVGRITEAKGHGLLLNAMNRLRPELQKKIRLIVVGAPAPGCSEDLRYADRLKECAGRYRLQESIWWAGHQSDLNPYYALMDVLLHPSSAEALGLTILEALQRGIPVIASRTGGIPEIVRDETNGLLVSPGDEEALVRSLERFMTDESIRRRLIAGASAGIDSRFQAETFRPAIRHLLHELCDSSTLNRSRAGSEGLTIWK